MKAGVISDTHDHAPGAREALEVFAREGVEIVLHLGDVCRPAILGPFRKCGIPLRGVFGNNDSDRAGLQEASGGAFAQGPRILTLGDRKILMAHAFDELYPEIGEGGKFDLILFGHTHRPLTMRVGRALVLNPGEACGFMSGKPTCALIDLAALSARIVEIPAEPEPSRPESGTSAGRCRW